LNEIHAFCATHQLPLHLDGARVFNALAVNGINPQTYGKMFDSISICLSKGLGAPVGSVLIGNQTFIDKSRRVRKVLGGGMRQAGILAAAGIYALDHHLDRIAEDHRRAKVLGEVLMLQSWVKEVLPVETNIVVAVLMLEEQRDEIQSKLLLQGVSCIAFGPGMLRFVTHLNIDDEALEKGINAVKSI
jgi:threonine aldolase